MNGIRTVRHEKMLIQLAPGQELEAVLAALATSGDILKESSKFRTRRVGAFVVKESLSAGGAGTLKRTVLRGRYRRAWRASLFLHSHGVDVPTPRAFCEERRGGLICRNVLVMDFLEGMVNVEAYARALSEEDAGQFLAALGDAVNGLVRTRAYHPDLSGKNIFTGNGASFSFIDLDDVRLGGAYTERKRLANLIQLYDSFCDLWTDAVLQPFVQALLPQGADADAWFSAVRKGQAARRARVEAVWRKKGRKQRP